jgi:hypothetical protein
MDQEEKANRPESASSVPSNETAARNSEWLRMAAVAAASAALGGLAAAWFYRKTLTRLREADTNAVPEEPAPPGEEFGEGI